MSVDLFDPDDFVGGGVSANRPAGWKPPTIPPLQTQVTQAVLVTRRPVLPQEEGEVLELADADLCCPRCTETMGQDRFILQRTDGSHELCSLMCAVKHDRMLGTSYGSYIRPLKTSKNPKMSGGF